MDSVSLRTAGAVRFGRPEFWLGLALVLSTLLLFWPATGFELVNFDDAEFLETSNAYQGLTSEGIQRAVSGQVLVHWLPALWLSYMLDGQVFGPSPVGFHVTNILLHAANVFLVFILLRRVIGRAPLAAACALLWAVHPLRVEPVAWVAGRKDLLSTTFLLLALTVWIEFLRTRKKRLFFATFTAFVLALMVKPVLVTFPIFLLALDIWPLGRWTFKGASGGNRSPSLYGLLTEKAPFIAVGAATGAFTLLRHKEVGYLGTMDASGIVANIGRASLACVVYLRDIVWPFSIGPRFADLPPSPPGPWHLASLIVLLALVAAASFARRRFPAIVAGGLWYLAGILPVSGIFQVGSQWVADRYTYVPDILLIAAIAWTLDSVLKRKTRWIAIAAAVALAVSWSTLDRFQIGVWRTPMSFAQRAVELNPGNFYAQGVMAIALDSAGDKVGALQIYRRLVSQYPRQINLRYWFAVLLLENQFVEEGISELQEILRRNPSHAQSLMQLGNLAYARGDRDAAYDYFSRFVVADPDHPGAPAAQHRLGLILDKRGEAAQSLKHLRRAVAGAPQRSVYHFNLAVVLAKVEDTREAVPQYLEAIRLNPSDVQSRLNLAELFIGMGETDAAAAHWRKVSDLVPSNAEGFYALGRLALLKGDASGAAELFNRGLKAGSTSEEMTLALKGALAELASPPSGAGGGR